MDADRFDRLARSLSVPGTRRRLVRLLATLPLAALLPALSGVARTRRRERGQRTGAEACIPTGKKCPAKKPRGRKGKKLGCKDCCQGFVSVEATGQRRCGCIPTGVGCGTNGSAGCCSGSCQGGVCRPATAACTPRPSCPPGACGSVGDGCGGTIACGPCPCAPPCHPTCQTCNTSTRECEDVAPGTACDDGDLCTQTDTCQGGACVGGNPVDCINPNECQTGPGACDPGTGACAYPSKANGTECGTQSQPNGGTIRCCNGACPDPECDPSGPVVDETCVDPNQCRFLNCCAEQGVGCDGPTLTCFCFGAEAGQPCGSDQDCRGHGGLETACICGTCQSPP